jgi:hypothetical protein
MMLYLAGKCTTEQVDPAWAYVLNETYTCGPPNCLEQLCTVRWHLGGIFCCSFLAYLRIKASVQTLRLLQYLSRMLY